MRRVERAAVEQGIARWFGARDESGMLVGSAGIVLCPNEQICVGRFQDVAVKETHRKRGIASHLIRAAHEWALQHGASETVIVADAEREAIDLYRHLGFSVADECWMVFTRDLE